VIAHENALLVLHFVARGERFQKPQSTYERSSAQSVFIGEGIFLPF
jgi:hypothetical protein